MSAHIPFSPQCSSIGLSCCPGFRTSSCHCPRWPPCGQSHWTSFSLTPIFSRFLRNSWPSWSLPPSWKNVLPWFWGHHTLLIYISHYSPVSFMGSFYMLRHILPAVYAIAIPSCFPMNKTPVLFRTARRTAKNTSFPLLKVRGGYVS